MVSVLLRVSGVKNRFSVVTFSINRDRSSAWWFARCTFWWVGGYAGRLDDLTAPNEIGDRRLMLVDRAVMDAVTDDVESIQIISYPHPTLRMVAKPIVRVDAELRRVAARMLDLMYEHNGVGLAATQVNIPLRLFVMNETGNREQGEELILINPECQRPKGNEVSQEGCLSLPEVHGDVKRPKQIQLTAYSIDGELIERTVDGFLARVIQHEYDHLEGMLFFDRMTEEGRVELEGRLAELESDFRHRQKSGEIAADDALVSSIRRWHERYA